MGVTSVSTMLLIALLVIILHKAVVIEVGIMMAEQMMDSKIPELVLLFIGMSNGKLFSY